MSNVVLRHVPPSVADKFERMSKRMANMAKNAQEQTAKAVRTAECAAAGAVLGFLDGRYDRTELFGAPLAGVAGVGFHIGGFVVGGDEAEHLHAIGDGCLAVYSAKVAKDVGVDRKNKANGQTNSTASFTLPRAA